MFGPPGCLTETALNYAAATSCIPPHSSTEAKVTTERQSSGRTKGLPTRTQGQQTPPIPADWGIFPRMAMHLLSLPGCTLHASAVEVYQDVVYDLLNDSKRISISSQHKSTTPLVTVTGGLNGVSKGADGVHLATCRCGKCVIAKKAASQARIQAIRDKQERAGASLRESTRGRTGRIDAPPVGSSSSSFQRSGGGGGDLFATVGETLLPLTGGEEAARLARTVELSRVAHGHLLNSRSSRSHCIVRVYIKQEDVGGGSGNTRKQQFCFVDLAGSERIQKSGVSGKRQSEAMEINQSLSVLGRVIMKLVERERTGRKDNACSGGMHSSAHIPFRDSTLTKLLQSSFDGSGHSCTAVVINASASPQHLKETLSSLRFGAGMARVQPVVSINTLKGRGEETRQLVMMKAELERKRQRLSDMMEAGMGGRFGAGAVPSEKKTFLKNQEELKELSLAKKALKIRLSEARSAAASSADTAAIASDGKSSGSRGSSSSSSSSTGIREMEAQLSQLSWRESNIGDVVLRQKYIPGFWIPPTALFKGLQAEVVLLEGQLKTM
jgi:hypothetical protein